MDVPNIIDKNILDLEVKQSDFALLLEDRRKEKKFTDVQLQVGDQLFDAHRVVLSLCSPVLEAAVSDQWSTSKVVSISSEYVDSSIVECLLRFLYTGSIQLTPDNVHPVCVAAHFLQIPSLLEPSVKHLCRLHTVENALSLFEFSVTCELKLLRISCLQTIAKNHEKIFQDFQILKFSSRIFNDLISGLKEQRRSRMMLKENTFDCIVCWAEVNLSKRLNKLPLLLKNIPLEKLSLNYLTTTVCNHQLVKDSIPCIEAISMASELCSNTQPERGDNLVVLSRDGQRVSCYDSETKVWKDLPSMLGWRYDFAMTIVNRKDIVVCGGSSKWNYDCGTKRLDTVEMFEWSSQTWKPLPAMPFCSHSCSIAALDGHLYVIGKGDNTDSNEVCRYTFERQQWQYVKPMNISRYYAKLIEYDGYLYVFGGGTTTVERYDSLLEEWTCLDDKQKFTDHIKDVILHENKIYAYRSHFDYLEEFDPETEQWTTSFQRNCRGTMTSMNDQLLIGVEDTKWIHKYCFTEMKWTDFCEMNWDIRSCYMVTGAFY